MLFPWIYKTGRLNKKTIHLKMASLFYFFHTLPARGCAFLLSLRPILRYVWNGNQMQPETKAVQQNITGTQKSHVKVYLKEIIRHMYKYTWRLSTTNCYYNDDSIIGKTSEKPKCPQRGDELNKWGLSLWITASYSLPTCNLQRHLQKRMPNSHPFSNLLLSVFPM